MLHPQFTRRQSIQAGAVGLLGLSLEHLLALRSEAAAKREKSVIFVFLSGGLAQHDSFDMKPDAPDTIRGEFRPIATATPGTQICEHLPKLASLSNHWSLVRSLTHSSNEHSAGHHIVLTGRSKLPPGFNPNKPLESDWPSMASIISGICKPKNNLPPAVVLPERLIHRTGRVIPGQTAGIMGKQHDPWFLNASAFDSAAYGAFPTYEFSHQDKKYAAKRQQFELPNLSLPEQVPGARFQDRLSLLKGLDAQRASLDSEASGGRLDPHRDRALSMILDPDVRRAFDITLQPQAVREKYGDHSFGWSLLMAARLVEAGVRLVQVNLGNNETWDTHGNAFPHLKDKLFPPTDQALAALLTDLQERGLLQDTLVVVAGEFGRTPKVFGLPQHYKLPGRDHWGAAQSILLAGGGIHAGRVVGSTDKSGAYPKTSPQTPENLAATIYHVLGIPSTDMWLDPLDRPHHIYHGEPIQELLS